MMTMCQHEYKVVRYIFLENGSLDASERIMRLDYYVNAVDREWGLREDHGLSGADIAMSYGVGITKTEADAFEESFIYDVTVNKDRACDILQMLAKYCVTPCCMRDVLEDLITEEYSL